MNMKSAVAAALGLLCLSVGVVEARDFNRNYTNDEQTLCQPDVFRLCNNEVPDEDRIVACMTARRGELSPACRKVFDVGLKKYRAQ